MRVSQFEIHRLIQRAMEALGAGYGADRDAARSAAWLEARQLPGLAAFERDLAGLEAALPTPRIERRGESEIVIALNGSAIAVAGVLLDLVVGETRRSGQVLLRLRGCTMPLYLIPAAIEAGLGAPLSLAWPTALGGVGAVIGGGEATLSLTPATESGAALLAAPTGEVVLAVPGTVPFSPRLDPVLTPDALTQRFDESLSKGIAIDPGLWCRLDKVAARVQVPASTVSRERGAGGGDANI
jgi:hypothetical protein